MHPSEATSRQAARAAVVEALGDVGLEWQQRADWLFSVQLPGTAKLSTDCAIEVGQHTLSLRAFVVRHPDENHRAVYRWLLERNLKLAGVCFSVDAVGDIFLVARLALASVTRAEVDRLLGVIAGTADSSFNPLLGLGFASSIVKEWTWRLARGESTHNLDAFEYLRPTPSEDSPGTHQA